MKQVYTLALALLLALSLAACGGKEADATGSGDSGTTDIPSPKANSEFVFVYQDCPLPMNAEIGPMLAFLGEPDSYFEAARSEERRVGKECL